MCIISKSSARKRTRDTLIQVINWISHGLKSLFTWNRKVHNTNNLRTTTVQIIIPMHEGESVCLIDLGSSERLDDACRFKFTYQNLLDFLFWVLGSYVPYSTKEQHISYMENLGKFWTFLNLLGSSQNLEKLQWNFSFRKISLDFF